MGRARALSLFVILAICSFAVPAFGDEPPTSTDNWKISSSLVNTSMVNKDDKVTFEFEIKNIGTQRSLVNSPITILTPAEFTFESFDLPPFFECGYQERITRDSLGNDDLKFSYMIGRELSHCAPDQGSEHGALTYLEPNESLKFRVSGFANSNFNAASSVYSLYVYSVDEPTGTAYQNGENIFVTRSAPGISNAKYPFATPVPVEQNTTPPSQINMPRENKIVANVLSEVQNSVSPAITTNQVGQASASAPAKSTNAAKSPIVKDSKIQNTDDTDDNTSFDLAKFFSKNKTLIASYGTICFIAMFCLTYFVRKYRHNTQSQREYKRAITLLRDQKHKVKDQNSISARRSINRLTVNNQPVEMKSD